MIEGTFCAEILGREKVTLRLDATQKVINLVAIGRFTLVQKVQQLSAKFNGQPLDALGLPEGFEPGDHLLREVILKAQNAWNPPFAEDELCHCRGISREQVISSIYVGALTPEKVSRWTSASTACGTCRPDVEALITYFNFLALGRGS